jgi:hypothetical protein
MDIFLNTKFQSSTYLDIDMVKNTIIRSHEDIEQKMVIEAYSKYLEIIKEIKENPNIKIIHVVFGGTLHKTSTETYKNICLKIRYPPPLLNIMKKENCSMMVLNIDPKKSNCDIITETSQDIYFHEIFTYHSTNTNCHLNKILFNILDIVYERGGLISITDSVSLYHFYLPDDVTNNVYEYMKNNYDKNRFLKLNLRYNFDRVPLFGHGKDLFKLLKIPHLDIIGSETDGYHIKQQNPWGKNQDNSHKFILFNEDGTYFSYMNDFDWNYKNENNNITIDY